MSETRVSYQIEKKGFLRAWLLANVIGTFVGGIIIFVLFTRWEVYWYRPLAYYSNYPFLIRTYPVYVFSSGILVGNILIGWGEQMVIRRHTLLAIRWLLASAIGAILGAVILALPGIPSIYIRMQGTANIDPIYLLIWVPGFILLVGLIMGLLQWWAIRKTVSRAGTWIWKRVLSSFSFLLLSCPASLLAIILAGMNYGLFMVGQITPSPMDEQAIDNLLYIYCLIVLVIPATLSAIISGLFMRNLLESSAQELTLSPVMEEAHLENSPDVKQPIPQG